MLPFCVTIPATVPQRSEIQEGLTNYPVYTELSSGRLSFPLLFALVNEYFSIKPIWTYGDLISSLIVKFTVTRVQPINICYLLQGSTDF